MLLCLALAFVLPLLSHPTRTGISDWDLFCFWDELPRSTLAHYGQFPLWNAYANGGRPYFANPTTGFLRPTSIFPLLFGCVIGLKIEVLVMIFIGMLGMFFLMKQYKATTPAGIFAAALFGLSGYFALRIAEGHLPVLQFLWFPYIFLFLLKSFSDKKYLFVSSIFLSFMIFGGGIAYAVLPAFAFLVSYCVFLSMQKKSMLPVLHVALIIALALCISAVKLAPMLEYVHTHPRLTNTDDELMPISGLYHSLMDSTQTFRSDKYSWQKYWWHEYGSYVGIIPVVLFLFGVFSFWKKQASLIATGFLMLFFAMGAFAPWAPWTLVHLLPGYSSTRIPSRYIILFVFVLAIMAGASIKPLLERVKQLQFRKIFTIILVLLVCADLILYGHQSLKLATPYLPQQNIAWSDDFHHTNNTFWNVQFADPALKKEPIWMYSSMYWNLLANEGRLDAYDSIPHTAFAKAREDPTYQGEAYIEGNGTARLDYWSPNELTIVVDIQSQARLIINQNFDSGWKTADQRTVENHNGLLSAIVHPEDHTVRFIYSPNAFWIGAGITLLTLLFMTTFTIKTFKGKKKQRKR